MSNYIVLIVLTVFGAFGGYFLKKSVNSCQNVFKVIFSKFFYAGAILYIVSAILNVFVLKSLPYTIVLPFTAITYIWTMLIAYFFMKEKITKQKIYGIIAIIVGVVLIGIS